MMKKRLEIGKLLKGDKRLKGETFVEYKERLKLEKLGKDNIWPKYALDILVYGRGCHILPCCSVCSQFSEENSYGRDHQESK